MAEHGDIEKETDICYTCLPGVEDAVKKWLNQAACFVDPIVETISSSHYGRELLPHGVHDLLKKLDKGGVTLNFVKNYTKSAITMVKGKIEGTPPRTLSSDPFKCETMNSSSLTTSGTDSLTHGGYVAGRPPDTNIASLYQQDTELSSEDIIQQSPPQGNFSPMKRVATDSCPTRGRARHRASGGRGRGHFQTATVLPRNHSFSSDGRPVERRVNEISPSRIRSTSEPRVLQETEEREHLAAIEEQRAPRNTYDRGTQTPELEGRCMRCRHWGQDPDGANIRLGHVRRAQFGIPIIRKCVECKQTIRTRIVEFCIDCKQFICSMPGCQVHHCQSQNAARSRLFG